MDTDKEFFKSIFENTGNIDAYLIYKELSGENRSDTELAAQQK